MTYKIKEKMGQVIAPVALNKPVAPGVFRLRLEAPDLARSARPGQFVMLRIGDSLDPLLRRPFSVHNTDGFRTLDILYRVVGKGTKLLANIKEGEALDVLGPLGQGFSWQKDSPALLIAGGMGMAPLFFLAWFIGHQGGREKTSVIIGARNRVEVLCTEELRALGLRVHVATEDGSRGKRGLVTDLITRELVAPKPHFYSCGPYPMLRAVANIAKEHGLSGQVSLEKSMACGVGACLGCVCRMRDGSLARVCKEGPVFEASEVEWR